MYQFVAVSVLPLFGLARSQALVYVLALQAVNYAAVTGWEMANLRSFFGRPRTMVAAVILLAGIAGATWFVARYQFVSWDFRNNLWGPIYLLVRGQNPYDIRQLCLGCNAIWLPTTLGLFFPLGWLGQYPAANLWLLANLVALAVIVWLAAGERRPAPRWFAAVLALAFLSPITISHLLVGQFTLVSMLATLVATSAPGPLPGPSSSERTRLKEDASPLSIGDFPRGRGWGWGSVFAGFLLALVMAKPQLEILVLPGLFSHFWRSGGWRRSVAFLAGWAATLAALTIPLWVAYPDWPRAFAQAVRRNPAWIQPTLFWVLRDWLGGWGVCLWAAAAVGIFGLNLHLWRTQPPEEAVCWSLALTALITPYLWSYDFVLLIPLLARAAFRWRSVGRRAALALSWLIPGGIMLWIRFNTDNSDHRYWWVPWVIMGVVWLGEWVNGCAADERMV